MTRASVIENPLMFLRTKVNHAKYKICSVVEHTANIE